MDKYSHKEKSKRYSRYRETSLQERDRSQSPYFHQETTHQEETSLNRSGSQTSRYSRHEDLLLNKSKSKAPQEDVSYRSKSPHRSRSQSSSHSFQEGMSLNTRDKRYERERRERSISKEDYRRNEGRGRVREGNFVGIYI
jgi:hypothetical protein